MRRSTQVTEMRTPKVGIREFRSGLAEFIAAATPVAITRHGHTVAYFIPTSAESEPDMAALKRASGSLDAGAAKGKGTEMTLVSCGKSYCGVVTIKSKAL